MPPSVFPTGVTVYNPDKAYNCYTFFDGRDQQSYLVDMNGSVVKIYPYCGFPAEIIAPTLVDGEKGREAFHRPTTTSIPVPRS